MGFNNIEIYNGGIKDWRKSGFVLESKKTLPETEISFIESDGLYSLLQEFDTTGCQSPEGQPLLTLLDFRNANFDNVDPPPQIATTCPTKRFQLDDVLLPQVRAKLPRQGTVIILTETGNRDEFVIRYLSQYHFKTYKSLKYGMRGWLKKRYPIIR